MNSAGANDHADVLGRYRRLSPVDGEPIDAGLLTSGAAFGDEPFFELIERVAENLARLGLGLSLPCAELHTG